MSAKQTNRPGRPATGTTKAKPGLTIDKRLVAKAKKAAFRENMSLSAYVERAIANFINTGAEA
jgi:predicted HicB family RNase H-like nuclease